MKEKTVHSIPPFFDSGSSILILGSFPSVKSREQEFYYAHPQNRFWKVVAAVFDDNLPVTVGEKKSFLTKHHIALWDVIKSCNIEGSSDMSINNVTPNDISIILDNAKIQKIFINGTTAFKFYEKYLAAKTDIPAVCLPSTSPANAKYSLEKLIICYKEIFKERLWNIYG